MKPQDAALAPLPDRTANLRAKIDPQLGGLGVRARNCLLSENIHSRADLVAYMVKHGALCLVRVPNLGKVSAAEIMQWLGADPADLSAAHRCHTEAQNNFDVAARATAQAHVELASLDRVMTGVWASVAKAEAAEAQGSTPTN